MNQTIQLQARDYETRLNRHSLNIETEDSFKVKDYKHTCHEKIKHKKAAVVILISEKVSKCQIKDYHLK